MKKYSIKKIAIIGALVVLCGGLLTACDNAYTTTASCAFLVNNGNDTDGNDTNKLDGIVYPQQKYDNSSDDTYFFPCNARNFIVNNGKVRNANGDKVGDRFTRTVAYTEDTPSSNPSASGTSTTTTSKGTKVLISWKAFWTLNQTKSVLEKDFYPLCFKYHCYSKNDTGGGANYSTKGWNGMLGENFGPAADSDLLTQAKAHLSDSAWQNHDTSQWNDLAKAASDNFDDAVRAYTGVQDDIFCGSGNSGWDNPAKPGEGKFTCSNVRFVIDSIVPADSTLQNLADRDTKALQEAKVNSDELAAAKAKYGDNADYWLGLQDTLSKCKSKTTCIVNIGGGNSPSVSVPTGK